MKGVAIALSFLTATALAGERELKLEDAGGREIFTLKWEASGAKLVDPSEHELARLKPKDDRLKIEEAADAFVGEVTGTVDKLSIKDATKSLLFVLRRQADGDYKLEDGHERLLAKLERKGPDYVRVEDGAGQTIFKVKSRHGKLVITSAANAPTLSTQGPASLMGFAMFALDRLSPAQKAAAFYRLDTMGVP